MFDVVLKQTSLQPHTGMLLAGAIELEKQGIIKLEIQDNRFVSNDISSNIGVTEVLINNRLCYFDYSDGYSDCVDFKRSLMQKCDFYFRRSYLDKYNAELFPDYKNKIYSLGMNYYVYAHGQRIIFDGRPTWKRILRKILGYKADSDFTIDVFENKADYKKLDPIILFYTRLWEETTERYGRYNHIINKMRIDIIRELRNRYGTMFKGGVYQNSLAEKLCPDLIVPKNQTDRYTYIQNMKSADICIGTMGLDESIGWKTAEYVAASRAIVHEKFHYEIPGNFTKRNNYMEFSSVSECLECVQKLIDNPDLLYSMKKANQLYYETYLRPDRQLWSALQVVRNN